LQQQNLNANAVSEKYDVMNLKLIIPRFNRVKTPALKQWVSSHLAGIYITCVVTLAAQIHLHNA